MADGADKSAAEFVYKVRVDFLKTLMEIFKGLAGRPYHQKEVEKFVKALVVLIKYNGLSFEEINTSPEGLEEIVTKAFVETIGSMMKIHDRTEGEQLRIEAGKALESLRAAT